MSADDLKTELIHKKTPYLSKSAIGDKSWTVGTKRVGGCFVTEKVSCSIDSPMGPSVDKRISQLVGVDDKRS